MRDAEDIMREASAKACEEECEEAAERGARSQRGATSSDAALMTSCTFSFFIARDPLFGVSALLRLPSPLRLDTAHIIPRTRQR